MGQVRFFLAPFFVRFFHFFSCGFIIHQGNKNKNLSKHTLQVHSPIADHKSSNFPTNKHKIAAIVRGVMFLSLPICDVNFSQIAWESGESVGGRSSHCPVVALATGLAFSRAYGGSGFARPFVGLWTGWGGWIFCKKMGHISGGKESPHGLIYHYTRYGIMGHLGLFGLRRLSSATCLEDHPF